MEADLSKFTNVFFYVLLFLFVVLIAVFIYQIYKLNVSKNNIENYKVTTAKINGKKYKLEIADTNELRAKGLMFREEMSDDNGMLFIFNIENIYPFWMKNTYIPLDIIWLNKDKEVVFIAKDVQPCQNMVEAVCKSVVPSARASYVIELNSGQADKLDLKTGDKIDFQL